MHEMMVKDRLAQTKSAIGMDQHGNDLSNKRIIISDYAKNMYGENWFCVDISFTRGAITNIILEFVMRVNRTYGPDYKIDSDQCVCGYINELSQTYIFQLDELTEPPYQYHYKNKF